MHPQLQSTLIENTYLFALLTLIITMYGPRLAPTLPASIKDLFGNTLFRTLMIFLLVFMSKQNLKVSIVITVIYLVIQGMIDKDNALLSILYNNKTTSEFPDKDVQEQISENFSSGPPVAKCDIYSPSNMELTGTAFYPMHQGKTTFSSECLNNITTEEEK